MVFFHVLVCIFSSLVFWIDQIAMGNRWRKKMLFDTLICSIVVISF